MKTILVAIVVVVSLALGADLSASDRGPGWILHTIDDTSRGADGIRPADVNGDGLMDLTTGWEEGGRVRVYLNPGPKRAKQPWPAVTVGRVRSPEDAVFADLDEDGSIDVVSCCEGSERTMFVHWAPAEKSKYLDESAWKTEAIPASQKAGLWMFCLPLQVDGKAGVDLVAAAKGRGAEIGWFESPAQPRRLADWRWHAIYEAGWIMSLCAVDVDGDRDLDVVTSDRKGKNRGCHWLENPGSGKAEQRSHWKVHPIGGLGREVMFLAPADLDRDGRLDFVSAVRGSDLLLFRRTAAARPQWKTSSIRMPPETGTGKGVEVADLDLDGRLDVVFTCENAQRKSGVLWLASPKSRGITDPDWTAHEISGKQKGVKFDLIQLLDLDADGDLDVITCEERDNLGIIWYENPAR